MGAMVEVTEVMPVRRGYLSGLARFKSKAHFLCPVCGGRAVRARSDTHGRVDVGDFYCLDHKEPFRAPLMQSDKEGNVTKDQEIIALAVEKQLHEKYESGGASSAAADEKPAAGLRLCRRQRAPLDRRAARSDFRSGFVPPDVPPKSAVDRIWLCSASEGCRSG